jgi:WD40 repeat protein
MANPTSFDKASQVWTLPWDADWVTAVTFLGSTRRLAAGNNLGQILVWDLPENAGASAPLPVRRLDGHTNVITRLYSTSDGRWLISASYDHTIRYWDLHAPTTGSASVPLNARTREDLIRRHSSKVPAPLEVKVPTQPPARVLEGHREWIVGLALSRDEKLLVGGDDGAKVIVWDRSAGRELRRWQLKGWTCALALSPDNSQALVAERIPLVFDSGRYAGIKLWDVATGQPQRDLQANFKDMYIAAAAYAPDGKLLALGRGGEVYGPEGKVFLFDPASGKKIRDLSPGHEGGVTDLAFHPDGVHLASAGRDTQVRLWKMPEGKLVKELGKPRGGQSKDWIHAVAFSADGRRLAAADMAGAVQIWNLA